MTLKFKRLLVYSLLLCMIILIDVAMSSYIIGSIGILEIYLDSSRRLAMISIAMLAVLNILANNVILKLSFSIK